MSLFDTGVRPLIDAHLKEKSEQVRDYGDYWSASSAGYCMRLNIFRRLGVPRVPEIQEGWERTTRVFESGHIFHQWIQGVTKDAGISAVQEAQLQDEDLMVRGHFDDLIKIDDNLILYDYKTAHSKSFDYSKGRPMSYYHKLQLGTYLYMLRKKKRLWVGTETNGKMIEGVDKVSEARILKISKDDLRMSEDQLIWSDELSREVNAYWVELNAYWNNKKLPSCTCAEQEQGFMGKRTKAGKVYNDFFYNDEPCSLDWYKLSKEKGLLK